MSAKDKRVKAAPPGKKYPSIHQYVTELLNQDGVTRLFIMEALLCYAHRVHNAPLCEVGAMTPHLINTSLWKTVAEKVLRTYADEYGEEEP